MSTVIPGLKPKSQVKGKYVDLVIYSSQVNNRAFISGVIKCPFTNKEFKVTLVPHTDQTKLGVVQILGGFENHVLRVKEYEKWIKVSMRPYSNGSFHKRRYFVCVQCNYKSTRLVDALLHLIKVHGFLVAKP